MSALKVVAIATLSSLVTGFLFTLFLNATVIDPVKAFVNTQYMCVSRETERAVREYE